MEEINATRCRNVVIPPFKVTYVVYTTIWNRTLGSCDVGGVYFFQFMMCACCNIWHATLKHWTADYQFYKITVAFISSIAGCHFSNRCPLSLTRSQVATSVIGRMRSNIQALVDAKGYTPKNDWRCLLSWRLCATLGSCLLPFSDWSLRLYIALGVADSASRLCYRQISFLRLTLSYELSRTYRTCCMYVGVLLGAFFFVASR